MKKQTPGAPYAPEGPSIPPARGAGEALPDAPQNISPLFRTL